MRMLGIDFGGKKIGLSFSEGKIAFPYKVLRIKEGEEAFEKVLKEVSSLKVDLVVIGRVNQGKMKREIELFAKKLSKHFKVKIRYQDETLTSKEAQLLTIQAGIKRSKRKLLEDAYSATLILQNFIDSQKLGN